MCTAETIILCYQSSQMDDLTVDASSWGANFATSIMNQPRTQVCTFIDPMNFTGEESLANSAHPVC